MKTLAKIICLLVLVFGFLGYAQGETGSGYAASYTWVRPTYMPAAAGALALAYAAEPNRLHQYTGIIKNETGHEVTVYSGNSDASLIIPANSWVEYTIWQRRYEVTAYCEGKPFYCLKINASPQCCPFMCKKYDFIAEIAQAGPKQYPGKKLKRRIRTFEPRG